MATKRTYTNNNSWGENSGEAIRALILHHNKVIDTIYALNFKIAENQVLTAMGLWNNLAIEGSYIVTVARANGINVKVNMQDGKIAYQHFSTFYEIYFKDETRLLVHSGDDKLDIKTAEAFLRDVIADHGNIVDILPMALEKASKEYSLNGYQTWPLIG